MSKFWFFDRKGRPTTNEKRICDTFNSLIDDGVVNNNQVEEYLEEYGKPMNESELDEMFGFLTGEDSNGKKYEYANDNDDSDDSDDVDYDDSDDVEYEEVASNSKSLKNNSIDFNPFEEPVIERAYTKGFQPKSKEGDDDDSDSEDDDDDENDNNNQKGFSSDDLRMPSDGESIVDGDSDEDEDIPEPEWASTGGFSGGSDEDEDEDYDDEDDDEDGGKLGGDNLQDLTPAQKRKSAEKTADALLSMYCQFVPMPFVKLSSFNEGKIQKLVFNNQLDLSMQLENNVSVKDYIDGVNEQAQEVFKVTDETREEIKDPLIDVLLEQDLALTPTQRLMFAIGGHILTMGFSASQLYQNNKQALETFEKFHSQMNQQKAPVYQGGGQVTKNKPRPRPRPEENLSKVEKESVEELMRQMVDNSSDDDDDDDDDEDDDDDIIDAEHDPRVEVSEDYGDDD